MQIMAKNVNTHKKIGSRCQCLSSNTDNVHIIYRKYMRCNVVVQTMTIICIKDGNEFVIYECLYNIVFVDVKQGVRTI